ncbi:hypothetical protein [Wenyingzhuangia marina]|uniref:Uncharacterized protein n=1 Tax=Wenyingzhuangia marina TaxID=1195760 RepID=A0A1M5U594_9FLAO|nr:hypothetical protein [Wenyingzhuangia marina]GGF69597.1 hypothetical protein GCM10011397_10690 [Wenyingzhuangia marina]SHH57863.1 hypothetical protein SAMN05444281_1028 [Wenyingzhuangia marina]
MRIVLKLSLIFILAIQCKSVEENKQSENDWVETQKSRDYFDYAVYIQKHPKSKNIEKALSEYLFLRDSVAGFLGCGKYNTSLSFVDEEKVLFDNELKSIDSLSFITFEYLKNGIPNVSTHKYDVQIPQSNMWDSISKVHFDIVFYDKPFPIKSLKFVLNEISDGIHNYKKYLSKKWYKKPYNELTDNLKIEIDYLNDSRLSFFDFSYMNGKRIVPPPPPEFDNDKFQTEE